MKTPSILLVVPLAATVLVSCGHSRKAEPKYTADGKFINPYPPGTYENFTADPKYPKTYSVWKNEPLLAKTDASNSHLVISIKRQRGFLMNGDDIVIDYPICSGRSTHPTPPGNYSVLEKVVDKRSNRYGRIYDAGGECVNGDADATQDAIPEGGRFEGAQMSYWMRLTGDGIGHHIGPVKRYPASHACIRGPSAVMPIVYGKVKIGTPVEVTAGDGPEPRPTTSFAGRSSPLRSQPVAARP